ncbi:hypothetical protein CCUG60884_03916 [Mycobacteroides salmoniphilum]|uniref:Uncharacterized protein n=1 Tax=Mycobacteroides salmoniphilum TaxID=404941 RepID=A0A4V3I0L6_9MYCO|nr:hypothetical protein CCUG60884_03916 [Mycobacteroides salmoniphilum]
MDAEFTERVVLVGGRGLVRNDALKARVSSALACPDLLGTMLNRHHDDLNWAFADWERALEPFIDTAGDVESQGALALGKSRTGEAFGGGPQLLGDFQIAGSCRAADKCGVTAELVEAVRPHI